MLNTQAISKIKNYYLEQAYYFIIYTKNDFFSKNTRKIDSKNRHKILVVRIASYILCIEIGVGKIREFF